MTLRAEDLLINAGKYAGQAYLPSAWRVLRTNMRRLDRTLFIAFVTAIGIGGFFGGAQHVQAAIGYNGGAYVNLCGTGTAATNYTCSAACNPQTGSCSGSNNGVVKYVCSGRWDQCFEAESYWSNYAEIGNQSCGKTVQLSVFDKTCRKEDGTWDSSCKLQGYMVWYSGDCWSGVGPTPTPFGGGQVRSTPTGSPTVTPTIAPTSRLNPGVTMTPTPTNAPKVCGRTCVMQSDCGAGFTCYQGVCRNPACSADASCFCSTLGTSSSTGSGKTSPETGGGELLLFAIPGLFGAGFVARKYASKVW